MPHAELERLKLLPGAEARSLRGEVERLRAELMVHRQLVEDTTRAREHAEQELREVQQQHGAMVAELAHVRCERDGARGVLRDLDDQLAGAGVIKAWKLARARRKVAATARERSAGVTGGAGGALPWRSSSACGIVDIE